MRAILCLLAVALVSTTKYDVYITTSTEDYAGTEDGLYMKITGSAGTTDEFLIDDLTKADNVRGETDHHIAYERDIGVPECVTIRIGGTDGVKISKVMINSEDQEGVYCSGSIEEWWDDNESRTVCGFSAGVKYVMSAVTSNADWAETDDDIYVTVVGAAGTTRAVGTNDLTKDDTQRGETDNWTFYGEDVGQINCLRMKVDGDDGWTIDEMTITSEGSRYTYTTGSIEAEIDDWETRDFCALTVDDACDCSKEITSANWALTAIDYDISEGSCEPMKPVQVGYQELNNAGTAAEQWTTFSVSESVTETAQFTHTAGASVSMGTEFEVGVPLVSKAKVTASLTASYNFATGETTSSTKAVTATYYCKAPANTDVVCEALLFKYSTTVPYTQTWTHNKHGCECFSKGSFNEVAASKMTLTVDGKDEEETDIEATGGGFNS